MFALFLAAFVAAAWSVEDRNWRLAWLIPVLVATKFVMSAKQDPPVDGRASGLKVAVVVPVFNEDVTILQRTLLSILAQTRIPGSVDIIDDGSSSDAAGRLARGLSSEFERIGVTYRVTRLTTNRGKREALGAGFRAAPDADVYVCIDSDTQLTRDALGHLISRFSDPRVTAATGIVLPANHNRNLLTRLMDLRYAGAFLFGRASCSALGSVLCCSGAFSAFRGIVVRKHLTDFLSQRVRGRPVTIGDDRRLTNYCLLEGRAVLERRAVAETTVPERLGPYLRQQSRWNKSFIRESLWCVQHMPWHTTAFYVNMFELTLWLLFTALAIPGFMLVVFVGRHMLVKYLLVSSLLAYLQATRYFDITGVRRRPPMEKARIFLLAPIYGVIHLVLMVPLRFYSTLTIASIGWGTRRERAAPALPELDAEPPPRERAEAPSPRLASLVHPLGRQTMVRELVTPRMDTIPAGSVSVAAHLRLSSTPNKGQRSTERFEELYRELEEMLRTRQSPTARPVVPCP